MKSSVKIHSRAGRPTGATRNQTEIIRLRAYNLFLKGFNQLQIGESLGLDQSTVSHHLGVMRERNAGWFDTNRDPSNRYRGLFKQSVDMILQSLQEAWLNYHNCPTDKYETRSNLLGRVNQAHDQLIRTLGIKAPTLSDLEWVAEKSRIEDEIKRLQKMVEERRMSEKINPLTGP